MIDHVICKEQIECEYIETVLKGGGEGTIAQQTMDLSLNQFFTQSIMWSGLVKNFEKVR